MTAQTFMWRVGAIPVDVDMVEPGLYRFKVGSATHTARMHEKKNWSLSLGDAIVQIGLPSLRACVARAYEVPIDVVKNVSTG